ncbi:tRNA (adenosine(37)-N6)-threonylcarbamoyltransferase complex ATPase subunit type 1 TsaE [Geobacter sp. FeAm09]|uniref:tRNA (adenosine(37)-N6)-threonylcarbamoyltransferase complex ATPase subunit type 1 TsaE n=1 Tax=Geobacter sp. FeAm09 TaxID=2597769 RepID=UPI0011F048E8|nr:tRNA (adenosine(37)-N6)-threonylcarbamoyltransferase complex ATPase subunit type 1 TsaE [Geobacter sp. FeAm09]QEM68075.1 tRNA (adenosine(37)-N6)-threonylcarbamoyltransferase complex ATPase subunit type 1 TsaE [Geobacter sp. FeAm09]
MIQEVFHTSSPDETEELGRQVGALLEQGAFLALRGELGGGKTCFTRGVVQAAVPESAHLVASPTFAIMNQYPGRLPIYHFDFYRMAGEADIDDLGFTEYLQGDGVCIVEWSERLEGLLPDDHLRISFHDAGDDRRRIIMEARGPSSEILLSRLLRRIQDDKISLT